MLTEEFWLATAPIRFEGPSVEVCVEVILEQGVSLSIQEWSEKARQKHWDELEQEYRTKLDHLSDQKKAVKADLRAVKRMRLFSGSTKMPIASGGSEPQANSDESSA